MTSVSEKCHTGEAPIPENILKNLMFPVYFRRLAEAEELKKDVGFERLAKHKDLIRAAAKLVRDDLQKEPVLDLYSQTKII